MRVLVPAPYGFTQQSKQKEGDALPLCRVVRFSRKKKRKGLLIKLELQIKTSIIFSVNMFHAVFWTKKNLILCFSEIQFNQVSCSLSGYLRPVQTVEHANAFQIKSEKNENINKTCLMAIKFLRCYLLKLTLHSLIKIRLLLIKFFFKFSD